MKEWLKDHFEYGAFTPKPVGYCKRYPGWECAGCAALNTLAWWVQSTIFVVGSLGIIALIILTIVGVIKF